MAYLELQKLHKKFGDFTAIEEIDVSIEAGEFLSLLGPSGCGKTTALRIVAGFERPTSGRVRGRGQGPHPRVAQHARHGHGLPGLLASSRT